MKLKSIFMAMLAAAVSFVACETMKENPNDKPADVKVTPTELSFDAAEGSQAVEITATRNWTATASAEWVRVAVPSGEASLQPQQVSISVLANTGHDREAEVTFSIGLAKAAVKISQKGPGGVIDNGRGTKESPYTVAGVVDFINELGADVESSVKVYVKGKISAVSTTFEASGNYGNASFDMVDEDGSNIVFKAFQTYYLGNRKWKSGDKDVKVGDEVIIFGPVVNYKGNTPETVGKGASFIYSLNGESDGGDNNGNGGETGEAKGSGTEADPFNVAAVLAYVNGLGADVASNNEVYIKGKVGQVSEEYGAQYGNATFTMVDEGYGAEFTAYRILYLGNRKWKEGDKQIKAGDEVVVCGKVVLYRGNTPETQQNTAYLFSLNGDKGGSNTQPTGETKTVTVAEFNAAAESNTQKYQLTGVIGGSINTQYGNFDLTDDTGTVYVYGLTATELPYGTKNDQSFASLNLAAGDKITIIGYRGSYNDKIEVVYAYFVEKVSGGDPQQGDEAKGSGTLEDPYNAAAASQVASALDKDTKSNEVYVKGKISSIKYTFSAQYGTATFNISDDGSTTGTQFTCYSVFYLGNRPWVDGDTQIAVGDGVLIYGKLVNYNGNTPETASKEAYIYNLNGQTEGTPAAYCYVEGQKEFSVDAATTSVQFKVKANVAWEVNYASYAHATSVDPESGSSDATVTVTFPANTSTEAEVKYALKLQSVCDEVSILITQAKVTSGGGDGGDKIEIILNNTTTWSANTMGDYKGGFAATQADVKVGFYQYTSTSKPVAPDEYSVRIYKSSVFVVESLEGRKIKSILFTANNYSDGKYCKPLKVIEGGGDVDVLPADAATMLIGPWTGSATRVVLQAAEAQTRVEKVVIELE